MEVSSIAIYSKNGFIDSLSFDAIIEGDNFYLFYNLKDPNSDRHALVEQKAIGSGKHWETLLSLIIFILWIRSPSQFTKT